MGETLFRRGAGWVVGVLAVCHATSFAWAAHRAAATEREEEPDLPASIPTPLYCPNVDEAAPGVPIVLRCVARPNLDIGRVLLFYRVVGSEAFVMVTSKHSRAGWYKATIAADAVGGKQVQYYFEARDPSDQVVATAGKVDSPNIIILRAGANAAAGGATAILRYDRDELPRSEENEDPLARKRAEEEVATRRPPPTFWIGLGVGSGYGWAPSRHYEWRTDLTAPSGARASSLFHVAPEVGYHLNPDWALALAVRAQFIAKDGNDPSGVGSSASGALLVLLRGMRFFGQGPAKFYVDGLVGGGDGFRLVFPANTSDLPSSDTVRGGPVVLGAGGGLLYSVGRYFGFLVDVRVLVGLPDTAVVLDGTLGVQVAF